MNESVKTLLIAVVLLLLVCAVWFFFLYKPEKSKIVQIKEETSKLLNRLQSFQVTDEQISAMEKQVVNLKNEIAASQSRIVTKENLPNVVDEIKMLGKKFGLKFHLIIPDYDSLIDKADADTTVSIVQPLILHMKLQGRYKNFGEFLVALGKMRFSITLGEMNVVYNEEYFPDVDIQLDAVLYIYENVKSNS